jgi:hypothetical protein
VTTTRDETALQRVKLAIERAQASPVAARNGSAVLPTTNRGFLGRMLMDREDRRHEDTLKVTRNVAGEAVLAQAAIMAITTNLVEVGLEANASFERSIYAHADSELAAVAAPGLVQIANAVLVGTLEAIGEASKDVIISRMKG